MPCRAFIAIAAIAVLAGCATSGSRPVYVEERVMTVTAYCPCKKCCGWERNWYGMPIYASGGAKGERKKVGVTASGEKARPGTIAADPALPFGTQLYVPGYGYGVVQDRGGAIRGDRIDVFFKSHKRALEWGRQTVAVKILHPATQSAQAFR